MLLTNRIWNNAQHYSAQVANDMNLKKTGLLECGMHPALLLAGLAIFGPLTVSGQTYVVDQFNTDSTSSYINLGWGTAVPTITWDDTVNATTTLASNYPGSGASKWSVPWPTTGDQIEVVRAFNNGAVLNLNNYSSVSFDIMFASNSATDGNGTYGAVEIDAVPQSDGWPSTSLAIYTSSVANGNGWIHVTLPVNGALDSSLQAVTGMGIKIQQRETGSNLKGTTAFWLDNIIFSGYTNSPVNGPAQIIQVTAPAFWQRAEFQITNVPSVSNPFDPDVIRLDATFTMPSGRTMLVPGFWYQGYTRTLSGGAEEDVVSGPPQWRLRFTPPEIGSYSLSLAIKTNGVLYSTVVTNFIVASNSFPARYGYVTNAPGQRYFQTGDGQGLPLNGEDVAWWDVGTYDYDAWFASMSQSGENFARVWMSPWCFGIEDAPGTLNNYSLDPAWQLDYVLQLAEKDGIYIQLTLDDYREYSSVSGANDWPPNPYNSTNGGPCINVNAFVTDSAAQTIYQKRLRYLIGRYGYSQNLLAWEFFNEIDHDYASVSGQPASQSLNPANVATWHALMGNWMQTNDPYHHLLTTSVTYVYQRGDLWSLPQISYTSEHYYNLPGPAATMASDAQALRSSYGKPLMIGEFGTSWQSWEYEDNDPYYRGFREGIWGGALGGSTGTAMSWWWQNLANANLYYVYTSLGTILSRTGWGTGLWTNINFITTQQSPNTLSVTGLSGSYQSLVYVIAQDAAWPVGASNESLPVETGESITITNWPAGSYYVEWYDPASAALVSDGQVSATNASVTLPLPNYSEDLVAIVYSAPKLAHPSINQTGGFQSQLQAAIGGIYDLLRSADLVHWTTLLTMTNRQTDTTVTDNSPGNNVATFYRVVQVKR